VTALRGAFLERQALDTRGKSGRRRRGELSRRAARVVSVGRICLVLLPTRAAYRVGAHGPPADDPARMRTTRFWYLGATSHSALVHACRSNCAGDREWCAGVSAAALRSFCNAVGGTGHLGGEVFQIAVEPVEHRTQFFISISRSNRRLDVQGWLRISLSNVGCAGRCIEGP